MELLLEDLDKHLHLQRQKTPQYVDFETLSVKKKKRLEKYMQTPCSLTVVPLNIPAFYIMVSDNKVIIFTGSETKQSRKKELKKD